MDDLLSPIRNAEREAEEIIKNAKVASKEKIAEAEANVRAMLEESVEENQLEYQKIVKQFEMEGHKQGDKIRASIDLECKSLIKKATLLMDEGAKKILERIII